LREWIWRRSRFTFGKGGRCHNAKGEKTRGRGGEPAADAREGESIGGRKRGGGRDGKPVT